MQYKLYLPSWHHIVLTLINIISIYALNRIGLGTKPPYIYLSLCILPYIVFQQVLGRQDKMQRKKTQGFYIMDDIAVG
jgi:hypothetical protein